MVDFISWQAATLIIGLLNLEIAIAFYLILPASKHFKPYPIQFSQTWIGLIAIAYWAGIYSSPRAASWSRKFGRDKVLPLMLLSMLLALWMMWIPSIVMVLLGLLIFTFSFFAAHSTSSSWVSVQSLQYRAVGLSLYLFCYYMSSSVMGSSSGLVWERFGWMGLTFFISFVLGLGLLLALKLKHRVTH